MTDDRQTTVAAFDQRAAQYSKNDWHRHYAERLVAFASLRSGQRVLDVGAGTGFATIAAARAVGPSGTVVAVDESSGMLERARAALAAADLSAVKLVQADATALGRFPSASFDVVICAAALLYMPVDRALREWHRLVKRDGHVCFSTMRADSPPAARLFRECAKEAGVPLADPSGELGSEGRCRAVLHRAGFSAIRVVPDYITFSAADLALAWEANYGSHAHLGLDRLNPAQRQALRDRYEAAVGRACAEDEVSFSRADVLYAAGKREKLLSDDI
jgi:ubiquinone/menaquinone biosynthesis C-methylase UbiE